VTRMARLAVASPALTALLAVAAPRAGFIPRVASLCADASGPHHAALVVTHGDGSTIRRCVSFTTASISGEDLLRAAKVEFSAMNFGSLGDAICQIDYEPASYPPTCFASSG